MAKFTPMPVSMLTPLEVPISKQVLVAVVSDTLRNITDKPLLGMHPDDVEEVLSLVAQRKAFLEWLTAQPGDEVAIAMYPIPLEASTPTLLDPREYRFMS